MRLLRLHVENFGKLQNFDLDLSEGVNVLHKENGWGKSTLAVFIKAMLYGLPVTSRRSLDENERRKYTPWQGGAFGGSLEFSCDRGAFRIERFFGAKEANDSFALFDLATNLPSTVFSAAVGEELFGIDADGFERSTYLSQREMDPGKENNSISAKLGNLLDDVGDVSNFDAAMEALDKRRKFYVMTGNRGAIADLENVRMDRQHELERCVRVKEAMEAQERELELCTTELQALQQTAEQTRERLQKAMLARERAAHVERKNRMLDELREMDGQLAEIKKAFLGQIPARDELAHARALYESIRETNARRDAMLESTQDQKEFFRLRSVYPSAEASRQLLSRMEADNDHLLHLNARIDLMRSADREDAILRRFPTGAPSQERISKCFDLLEGAERLQHATKESESSMPRKKHTALGAVLLAVLGVILFCSLPIPSLAPFAAIIATVGGALVLAGLLLGILTMAARKRERAYRVQLEQKNRTVQKQREAALSEVKALLNTYRISTEEGLPHGLTELSLLAKQYRRSAERRDKENAELAALEEQREETALRLRRAFDRVGRELPPKDDYRREVEQVRAEIEQLTRMEREDRLRTIERKRAEESLSEQKERLLPFLRRYDHAGRLRAGECLEQIGERLTEAERLTRALAEKQAELTAFMKEKQLREGEETIDAPEVDRLSSDEALLQKKIRELHERQARLRSSIERLSVDADRVPDLRSEIEGIRFRIAEAKENVLTVANTAKLLEEAKVALSTRYLGGMQESFSKYLTQLTGKSAPDAVMDPSFEVRLREGGQTRVMESFSRGWRDAVQFCVRLSLTDALFEGEERPFLLLDDPFVNLDDKRLDAARRMLDRLAEQYQILYLVCHKERA